MKEVISFPYPQPIMYSVEVRDDGFRVEGQQGDYDFWYATKGVFVPPRFFDGVVDLTKLREAVFTLDDEGVNEGELISLYVGKKKVTLCHRKCYLVGVVEEERRKAEHESLPLWIWKWMVAAFLPSEGECRVTIDGGIYLWELERWCLHIWKRRPPRQLEEYLDEE